MEEGGSPPMRRLLIGFLCAAFFAISAMTIQTLGRVFSFDAPVPAASREPMDKPRIVLISRERDTPFWRELERGAFEAAGRHGVQLQAWGSFGLYEADFLRNLELAIASRVDGIIAQGLDNDDFKKLTAIRAAENGIPVITVGSDVPVAESMRRTYVGSDHRAAGRLVAERLAEDLGGAGRVVVLTSERPAHFERERLAGILSVTERFDGIVVETASSGSANDELARVVRDRLNAHPDTKAFVSVAYHNAGVIAREIGRRFRAADFCLYAFDENPETVQLLRDGILRGIVAQDPYRMGEWSVSLMVRWLDGVDLPLDMDGYFTDIRLLTREAMP